jgi:hypothetical protein
LTKDEARREVLRLWRALPATERKSFAQATAFAQAIEASIEFTTVGVKTKIIAAWLQRDQLEHSAAAEAVKSRFAKIPAQAD